MPQTRVYLPLTPAQLRALAEHREIAPAPLLAHAVTTAPVRLGSRASDPEELEHLAWSAAAAQAREAAGESTRRVIASADVDSSAVQAGAEPGTSLVMVTEPVLARWVASFHVDEEPGGEDADLLWYDATELDAAVALVTASGPSGPSVPS